MATQWIEPNIKCPFYRSSERQRCEIICEAVTDAAIQIMRFRDSKAMEEQLVIYCADIHRMKRCEHYKALYNIKYGGD